MILMDSLQVLPQIHTQKEGHNESPGGVGYVCYLDCGDDIMGVCMCLNASSCAH